MTFNKVIRTFNNIIFTLKGSVDCGCKYRTGEGYPEFRSGYIIIIYFLIKSLRFEPCVERKNRFIFLK